MFDWQGWITKFRAQPGYNDAAHCVIIKPGSGFNVARCIGVHMLTKAENTFDHHVLMAVVDGDGASIPMAQIDWGWAGMLDRERPEPVLLEKQLPEPPGNLAMWKEYEYVWAQPLTVPGHVIDGADTVTGLTTWSMGGEPADAGDLYHRSFLVVWQVGVASEPVPEPGAGIDKAAIAADVRRCLELMDEAEEILIEHVLAGLEVG